MSTERIITIIAEELACKHPFRVAPIVTADSMFEDLRVNGIDLTCIAVAVGDAFGREFGDAEIEGWAGVADVVRSVEKVDA